MGIRDIPESLESMKLWSRVCYLLSINKHHIQYTHSSPIGLRKAVYGRGSYQQRGCRLHNGGTSLFRAQCLRITSLGWKFVNLLARRTRSHCYDVLRVPQAFPPPSYLTRLLQETSSTLVQPSLSSERPLFNFVRSEMADAPALRFQLPASCVVRFFEESGWYDQSENASYEIHGIALVQTGV